MGFIDFLDKAYEKRAEKVKIDTQKIQSEYINEVIDNIISIVVNNFSLLIQEARNNEQKMRLLESYIVQTIDKERITVPNMSRDELIKRVIDEIFGYSILQKYIDDPEVNDIEVNRYDVIYIRKGLEDILVPDKFKSEKHYEQFLYKIAAMCGQKLNDSNPIVDAEDPRYGLRINITFRPISYIAPSLIIRKGGKYIPLETMLKQGNISQGVYETFKLLSKIGCRIMFAGQMESGKTTIMSAFLNLIDRRMVIMEDTPELVVKKPNVLFQRTVNANTIGRKNQEELSVTLADLVRNFRRSNALMPVVGEVRGPEAVELLDIFNTGFLWGACSIHANSPMDVINQLVFQIKKSGKIGLDRSEIEEYISRTLDIIVYMEKRKVVEMVEVGYNYDKGKIDLRTIHKFVITKETPSTLEGYFKDFVNKFSSKMADRARRAGISEDSTIFKKFFEH